MLTTVDYVGAYLVEILGSCYTQVKLTIRSTNINLKRFNKYVLISYEIEITNKDR